MVPICQTSVDWSNLLYTHPARNKKGMQSLLSLPPPEGKKDTPLPFSSSPRLQAHKPWNLFQASHS